MLAEVTCVDQKDLRFATSKRMLVRVMKLLNVRPKLGKFHKPHVKDGKWVWMLVTRSNDPQRKVPIYFSVDQATMDAQLSVTRRAQDKLWTYRLPLPLDLKNASADEMFRQLGFFSDGEAHDIESDQ
jgi:hypothetical protein